MRNTLGSMICARTGEGLEAACNSSKRGALVRVHRIRSSRPIVWFTCSGSIYLTSYVIHLSIIAPCFCRILPLSMPCAHQFSHHSYTPFLIQPPRYRPVQTPKRDLHHVMSDKAGWASAHCSLDGNATSRAALTVERVEHARLFLTWSSNSSAAPFSSKDAVR